MSSPEPEGTEKKSDLTKKTSWEMHNRFGRRGGPLCPGSGLPQHPYGGILVPFRPSWRRF